MEGMVLLLFIVLKFIIIIFILISVVVHLEGKNVNNVGSAGDSSPTGTGVR